MSAGVGAPLAVPPTGVEALEHLCRALSVFAPEQVKLRVTCARFIEWLWAGGKCRRCGWPEAERKCRDCRFNCQGSHYAGGPLEYHCGKGGSPFDEVDGDHGCNFWKPYPYREERVCEGCGSYDEVYGRPGEFGCFGEWHPADYFDVPFPEVQGCPHWEAR